MKKTEKEEAERWLLQGKDDLKWSRHLLGEGAYHLTCFLSQQGTEKILKAFLIASGEELIRGHSVLDLCKKAVAYSPELALKCEEWKILDLFYIPTRYPNGLPSGIPAEAFSKSKAEEALNLAEDALSVLEKLIAGK